MLQYRPRQCNVFLSTDQTGSESYLLYILTRTLTQDFLFVLGLLLVHSPVKEIVSK